jgi:hypothetical protein
MQRRMRPKGHQVLHWVLTTYEDGNVWDLKLLGQSRVSHLFRKHGVGVLKEIN